MIEVLQQTGSTNADLLARIAAGLPANEGDWMVALRQDAGRGRQGRDWFDGLGNFMGSTAVHCRPGDPPVHTLALVAGLAVHEACSALAPDADLRLKWPNDLMAGHAKLAGILLERQGDTVVIGIGVNLAVAPVVPGRATAALAEFAPTPTPEEFGEALAGAFADGLARWRDFGLPSLLRCWQAAAHPLGTGLTVNGAGTESGQGAFAGLASDGSLQLRLADGTTHLVRSGEVLFTAPDDNRHA